MRYSPLVMAAGLLAVAAAAGPADGPPSAEDLDRLILQLGDDDLATRALARKRLEAMGEPAVAGLRKAADAADDPTVRTAAKAVLETLAAKAGGLIHMFRGHNPGITAIAISADGRVGVSAHDDWAIRFWDLDRCLLIRQIAKHVTPVLSVAITPDGRRVLSGSGARMIRLWDTQTGVEVRNFVAPAEEVHALAFSPDGKTIFVRLGRRQRPAVRPGKARAGPVVDDGPGRPDVGRRVYPRRQIRRDRRRQRGPGGRRRGRVPGALGPGHRQAGPAVRRPAGRGPPGHRLTRRHAGPVGRRRHHPAVGVSHRERAEAVGRHRGRARRR